MTAKLFLRCVGLIALLASVTTAQDAGSGRKRVVTYSGILKYGTGLPRVGALGLTLSLYAEQEGGDPLWRESQTIQTDEQGRYTLLLGATEEEGLPLEFFTSGSLLGARPRRRPSGAVTKIYGWDFVLPTRFGINVASPSASESIFCVSVCLLSTVAVLYGPFSP